MAPVVHPGRLLKRELAARKLSANRLSLDIGVPSGRVTDILNGRRSITADTAVRLSLLRQWRSVLDRLAGPLSLGL
jgi:addiction module HigA family antidote